MTQQHGDWCQTYTGRRFYPLDPRADDIDIVDIAHALSHICRFNGHCVRPYSVAEHSILVALHVAWDGSEPADRTTVLAALLHDASEAYLCDVPRPLKTMPEMAAYRVMEARVESVISDRFGLPQTMPAVVKRHDQRALATEYRDLVPVKRHPWHLPEPAWEDMPPGCLRTTQEAFNGMGIAGYGGTLHVNVRELFLALYRHLSGDTEVAVSEESAEQAAWLLRCLP